MRKHGIKDDEDEAPTWELILWAFGVAIVFVTPVALWLFVLFKK